MVLGFQCIQMGLRAIILLSYFTWRRPESDYFTLLFCNLEWYRVWFWASNASKWAWEQRKQKADRGLHNRSQSPSDSENRRQIGGYLKLPFLMLFWCFSDAFLMLFWCFSNESNETGFLSSWSWPCPKFQSPKRRRGRSQSKPIEEEAEEVCVLFSIHGKTGFQFCSDMWNRYVKSPPEPLQLAQLCMA